MYCTVSCPLMSSNEARDGKTPQIPFPHRTLIPIQPNASSPGVLVGYSPHTPHFRRPGIGVMSIRHANIIESLDTLLGIPPRARRTRV